MWLLLGPVLEPLEDTVVALNDPVLIDGSFLHLGCCDGHAKAHLQDPAPWTQKRRGLGDYLDEEARGQRLGTEKLGQEGTADIGTQWP